MNAKHTPDALIAALDEYALASAGIVLLEGSAYDIAMRRRDEARARIVQFVNAHNELLAALQVAAQAFNEIHHAKANPGWFTNGEVAALAHRATWERKGAEAVRAAIAKTEGNQS